jgi:hypothetical protein
MNSKILFVNFRWTFTFCLEKSYDRTHFAFGGTLDRRCNYKHVSLKQSRFYHCQTSTAHSLRDQVRRQFCHNKHKNSPYRPTRDVSLLFGHASYLAEALRLNSATGFIQYDYITPIELLTDMLSRIRHRVSHLNDEIQATVKALQ